MGLPSLFEDILDKQIENLLQDQVGNGQFFSKDELKKFLRHMGVTASSLFAVNDDKIAEMWADAVQNSNHLQVTISSLREELANEKKNYQKLRHKADDKALASQLKAASKENDKLRSKIQKLQEGLGNLKRQITQITTEKNKLIVQCKAQLDILNAIEAENNRLKSTNRSLETSLSDVQGLCHQLKGEVSRCRAELEELHRREMQKLIGE